MALSFIKYSSLIFLLLNDLRELKGDKNVTEFTSSEPSDKNLWELISSTTNNFMLKNEERRAGFFWSKNDEGEYDEIKKSNQNLQVRLGKLNFYFENLGIRDESCRNKFLCSLGKEPSKFYPLTVVLLDETRFRGDERVLEKILRKTTAGSKLLTYIQSARHGSQGESCEIFSHVCPQAAEEMVNYENLVIWREMSKWLTIKIVSKATF